MVVWYLRIDQWPSALIQMPCQCYQRDRRSTGFGGVHALATEHPTDVEAVQAANQPASTRHASVEYLDAVRMSKPMQRDVSALHRRSNPGSTLTGAPSTGTCRNDPFECSIHSHDPVRTAQAAAQPRRQADRVGAEHRASRRAPPQDRFVVRIPGKDAVAISVEQALWGKIATKCEQAIRFHKCSTWRWECCVWVQRQLRKLQAHATSTMRNGECALSCWRCWRTESRSSAHHCLSAIAKRGSASRCRLRTSDGRKPRAILCRP